MFTDIAYIVSKIAIETVFTILLPPLGIVISWITSRAAHSTANKKVTNMANIAIAVSPGSGRPTSLEELLSEKYKSTLSESG